MKSRPWKPSEMPGYTLDAPPNLRTSVPERPLSASRGRPSAPIARSSSVDAAPSGRPRRQSCSPARGRPPNGVIHASGSSVPAISRGLSKVSDNVSPVLIGTKMVERVINMRKLAPPKQEDKHSPRGNLSGKSASSPDSTGFGRTLSKKSLDMAIRHMVCISIQFIEFNVYGFKLGPGLRICKAYKLVTDQNISEPCLHISHQNIFLFSNGQANF